MTTQKIEYQRTLFQNNFLKGKDRMYCINKHNFKELPEIFSISEIADIEKSFMKALSNSTGVDYFTKLRNLTIFRTSYELALRPQECLRLRIDDIDWAKGVLRVPAEGNKLRRSRKLAIPYELLEQLKTYFSVLKAINSFAQTPYLFPSSRNEYLSNDQWQNVFSSHLKKIGLYKKPTRGTHGHLSPYALRHSKATQIYLKTKDIALLADILGHTSLECTLVYIHLAALNSQYLEDMRGAMSSKNVNIRFTNEGNAGIYRVS